MSISSRQRSAVRFQFPLRHGLHLRPATALRDFLRTMGVEGRLSKQGTESHARTSDVLSMVALDIRHQDWCEIEVLGAEAGSRLEEVRHWIARDFVTMDATATVPLPSGQEAPLPRALATASVQRGRAASGGITVAPIMHLQSRALVVPQGNDLRQSPDEQRHHLALALAAVADELRAQAAQVEGSARGVLEAHLALLEDQAWRERLQAATEFHPSLPQVIVAVTEADVERLESSSNPYLAGRGSDLRDVAYRLLRHSPGYLPQDEAATWDAPCVVVGDEVTPTQYLSWDRAKVRGLIMSKGSATGHTAILARADGIPCITGVSVPATVRQVVLDGQRALVITDPDDTAIRWYQHEIDGLAELRARQRRTAMESVKTLDGQVVQVHANIMEGASATQVMTEGADGIGLFRTEMLFLARSQPPDEELQYHDYRRAAMACAGQPVTIRLLDVGGDKQAPWMNLPREDNPYLGRRGVRLYDAHRDLLHTQVRAILRAACHGEVRVLVPMVTQASDLRLVRGLIEAAAASLAREGIAHRSSVPLGAMIEIPAAAIQVDQLLTEVSFLCVGTNDLIQYLFAADRGNPQVHQPEFEAHPALLSILRHIQSRAGSLPVTICGELAANTRLLPLLVGMGYRRLSVVGSAVAPVKHLLSTLDTVACARMAQACTHLMDGAAVLTYVAQCRFSHREPLLDESLILDDVQGRDRADVIKRMVERLRATGRCDDPDAIEAGIWAREDQHSTAITAGIAMPHGQSDRLRSTSVVVARLREPVVWDDSGTEVTMVVLVAVERRDGATDHLRIISSLARRLMHHDFVEELRCADLSTICRLLLDTPVSR